MTEVIPQTGAAVAADTRPEAVAVTQALTRARLGRAHDHAAGRMVPAGRLIALDFDGGAPAGLDGAALWVVDDQLDLTVPRTRASRFHSDRTSQVPLHFASEPQPVARVRGTQVRAARAQGADGDRLLLDIMHRFLAGAGGEASTGHTTPFEQSKHAVVCAHPLAQRLLPTLCALILDTATTAPWPYAAVSVRCATPAHPAGLSVAMLSPARTWRGRDNGVRLCAPAIAVAAPAGWLLDLNEALLVVPKPIEIPVPPIADPLMIRHGTICHGTRLPWTHPFEALSAHERLEAIEVVRQVAEVAAADLAKLGRNGATGRDRWLTQVLPRLLRPDCAVA